MRRALTEREVRFLVAHDDEVERLIAEMRDRGLHPDKVVVLLVDNDGDGEDDVGLADREGVQETLDDCDPKAAGHLRQLQGKTTLVAIVAGATLVGERLKQEPYGEA